MYFKVLAALHVYRIEIPYRDFPERVGPRTLSLERVDYFRTIDYFSGRKKENNLNEQNFEVYWKTRSEDRRWRMMGTEGKSVKTESRQKNVVPEIVVPKES